MAGEKVTANSPLIRDAFDSVNAASQPKPVTLVALDMAFTRLTRSVGIRPKEKKEEEGRRRRQDRHDIMLFHGIRKYVNHALVNAGCNMIAKELLIGHASPGLEGSYLWPTEGELLTEFVKAIPALSLSQENELRQQVDRLRVEVADIDVLKEGYLELKEDNKSACKNRLQRLLRQAKGQPKTSGYWTIWSHRLRLHNALQTCKSLSAYFSSSRFSSFFCILSS
jgi:hypothetical protein